MKTLQQIHQEKLIDEIFPSFSKDHQAMILKIIQRNEKNWLTQKCQENETKRKNAKLGTIA